MKSWKRRTPRCPLADSGVFFVRAMARCVGHFSPRTGGKVALGLIAMSSEDLGTVARQQKSDGGCQA